MAEYKELHSLRSNGDLIVKAQMAVLIAAYNLIKTGTTPTQAQQKWAAEVLRNPIAEAEKALMFALAKNATPANLSIGVIAAATDAAVQSAVDEVVPSLVAASGV